MQEAGLGLVVDGGARLRQARGGRTQRALRVADRGFEAARARVVRRRTRIGGLRGRRRG
jgi:hypothetical protein